MDSHVWKKAGLCLLVVIPGVQADAGLIPTVIGGSVAAVGFILTCLCCVRFCKHHPKPDPDLFEPINTRCYGVSVVDRYSNLPYDEVDNFPSTSGYSPSSRGQRYLFNSLNTTAVPITPIAFEPGYSPPPSYGSLFST